MIKNGLAQNIVEPHVVILVLVITIATMEDSSSSQPVIASFNVYLTTLLFQSFTMKRIAQIAASPYKMAVKKQNAWRRT